MDWENVYCSNSDCLYHGVPFYQGMMIKYGSSHGQKRALCKCCGKVTYLNDDGLVKSPLWG